MTSIWIQHRRANGRELNAGLEQQTDRASGVGPEKPEAAGGAFKADVKS
jgi:hypothetical protein